MRNISNIEVSDELNYFITLLFYIFCEKKWDEKPVLTLEVRPLPERRAAPSLKPFKPSRCIKASFYIIENRLYFLTTKGFRRQISMKLFYEYMAIYFNLSPTSSHLYPL